MWQSVVGLLFIVCTIRTCSVVAQYDDEFSTEKLRLQDIENEHNHRDYQRQQLEGLRQQQPPLPPKVSNKDEVTQIGPPTRNLQPNIHTTFRKIPQSVRPLQQVINPPERPLNTASIDYAPAAASNNNYGINPLTGNSLAAEGEEGADDSDVFSFSHAVPSLPLYLHRPQLELLSSGGAGYALSAADVLVPPYNEDNNNDILDERRHLPQLPAVGRYVRPLPVGGSRVPANRSSAPFGNVNNAVDSNQSELPVGRIEYAQQAKFSQDIARRPTFYGQSNQIAYAPIRPGGGALVTSPRNIPYPPSFISITTQSPEIEFEGFDPNSVLPLGRSLGYRNHFRPSPVDPIADLFANRQAKSLLDSYIPSWVVEKRLREQRNGLSGYNGYLGYIKRSLKLSDRAEAGNDIVDVNDEILGKETEKKVVKKSLDTQMANSFREIMTTA